MNVAERIAANLADVRARMQSACERAGRDADDVTLIAVTKYAQPEWIETLYHLGIRHFGESRPQQLIARAAAFPQDVRWHLIGHLQRNKSAMVLPHVHWIHSVDSERLALQLNRDAEQLGQNARIFLEVNVSGEISKDGFSARSLRTMWPKLRGLENLTFEGLMTMAPLADHPEAARPHFRLLRELQQELQAVAPASGMSGLSIGMSGDFTVAIEEGATMIRVGSTLFQGISQEAHRI